MRITGIRWESLAPQERFQRMKNLQGRVPRSPIKRFLLGGAFGFAISIPVFVSIDDLPVRFAFMAGFTLLMGISQVIAGSSQVLERPISRLLLILGVTALGFGLAFLFFLID